MLQDNFGINVAGHITGDFGLAEAVRSNINAMKAVGIPVALNNLSVVMGSHPDMTYTYFSDDNPYPINFVHTNPNFIYEGIYNGMFKNFGLDYLKNRYNIGFWAWELPKFPPEWEFAFEFFDEIWTPSQYVAEAIALVSPVPVIRIPHSIELPNPVLSRNALGLPKEKFIFLFIFDFVSSFERKNPFAVVESFKQAFDSSNQDVLLVLKFSNGHAHPQRREELEALIGDWPVQLIEGHLKREEVYALIKNCDCYVSLHRAEGFGLTMAEAMFYGKPVIATAYSSNMDFMNVSNSFMVKYELVTTVEDYGAYPKGSIWAEPDVDHAASFMRYVYEDNQAAKQVGARAAEDIRSLLSPHTVGLEIQNRLQLIMKWLQTPGYSSRLSKRIVELKSEINWWSSQSSAWRQTAEQVAREIKHLKSELPRY
ncbi:Glycosyl transferase family 2 [Planktothrix agardhii]|jgi:glycosyltransferase involved in cell wall biosynthesis|uniref:Glycosyl transferase family 2 n=1 Tax=Planktothrix agardhii TaxID=1160 RepID=A0A1J1JHZ4_PLAAG|nr:glycosyltransferase family 4 protein [Planktothrix agardhii]CAD5929406.1 Glycosyl transferase family 2 [Planktothrix agardhii]CUM61120.1 Glycosyl transferase family 2 [Planktothrix agardhii]